MKDTGAPAPDAGLDKVSRHIFAKNLGDAGMQVVQAFQANHGFGVRRPIGTLRASLQIDVCLGIKLQATAAQKRGQRRVSDPEKMFQGEGRATQRAMLSGKI